VRNCIWSARVAAPEFFDLAGPVEVSAGTGPKGWEASLTSTTIGGPDEASHGLTCPLTVCFSEIRVAVHGTRRESGTVAPL
jgi:hypothetical protein